MPLYTIMTQRNSLDLATKATLAERLTNLHSESSGVPIEWVHIVFQDFEPGNGFSAGVPAPTVTMMANIRSGRTSEYKRDLLASIWKLLQAATNAPDDQIVIGLLEADPSNAMEMGKIMPDVARATDVG